MHTQTHSHTPAQQQHMNERNLSSIQWNGIKYINKVKYTTKPNKTSNTKTFLTNLRVFGFGVGRFVYLPKIQRGEKETLCFSSWFLFRWIVKQPVTVLHSLFSLKTKKKKQVNDICIYIYIWLVIWFVVRTCLPCLLLACFDSSIWSPLFHWKWKNELKI